MNIESLIKKIEKYNPKTDQDLIRLAFDYAKRAHGKAKRKTGEPYIVHPLATANILADLKMDDSTIIAGLLHDVPEDTSVTLAEVKKEFGKDVAHLIEGITKLGRLKYRGVDRYLENLRKMFVAMAADVRTIIIKFADRMHNLKTLSVLPQDKQKRIAQETIEIYAPIAGRLGMGEIKGQLEDLAFPYAYPKEYQWLVKKIRPSIQEGQKDIKYIKKEIEKILKENKIEIVSIHGRTKHLYSLYKKLLKYEKDPSKIHDLTALRIIVPSVADCYAAMGFIHQKFRPLKGHIKDYIAQPKPSGYKSIHTTIFCQHSKPVEIQVRTPEMHQLAEYGIAAHWHYTEAGKTGQYRSVPKEKLAWIDHLLKFQKQMADDQQYLESLKIEFFKDRIFVFTPKGDVIDLPEDATPIDFAYHIHSELGDSCEGVKINEKIASLNTPLKSGDLVEIISSKKRKGPSRDWLDFAKTSTAKNKIKYAISMQKRGLIGKALKAARVAEERFKYASQAKKTRKRKNKT